MSDLQYARSTALFANGIFAGLSICIHLSSVPSIKNAVNPTCVFRAVYKGGSEIGISSILISTGAHLYMYYRTRDSRSLYLGLLSFVSFPYTLLVMRPVNNKLFALDSTLSTEHYKADSPHKKEVLDLLNQWNKRQMFRTATSVIAFLISVIYI
ncbi:hypothetical protein J3Q64DRAFT_1743967 [Phycomyces blakesleeanus]|uniref:DUF1772 domain-containing protein n=1 Tax=Phycomyces blakesleeanus TaxID=4837 RepID=A0ABR3B2F0_PHYBL